MDKQAIEELIAIMDEAGLTALRVADGDTKIELERGSSALGASSLPLMAERVGALLSDRENSLVGLGTAASAGNGEGGITDDDHSVIVRSPMVGMFYISPSPDEDAFVKVGQEVLSGQTMAIVEAMKMMNEIPAPTPGVVAEVFAANGTQVEYDQPLFRLSTENAQ